MGNGASIQTNATVGRIATTLRKHGSVGTRPIAERGGMRITDHAPLIRGHRRQNATMLNRSSTSSESEASPEKPVQTTTVDPFKDLDFEATSNAVAQTPAKAAPRDGNENTPPNGNSNTKKKQSLTSMLLMNEAAKPAWQGPAADYSPEKGRLKRAPSSRQPEAQPKNHSLLRARAGHISYHASFYKKVTIEGEPELVEILSVTIKAPRQLEIGDDIYLKIDRAMREKMTNTEQSSVYDVVISTSENIYPGINMKRWNCFEFLANHMTGLEWKDTIKEAGKGAPTPKIN